MQGIDNNLDDMINLLTIFKRPEFFVKLDEKHFGYLYYKSTCSLEDLLRNLFLPKHSFK